MINQLTPITEKYLLQNNFVKTKGQFGEYFFHKTYQLFRCWFHNGELQIGKKYDVKNICVWIATIDNEIDFAYLFRILTKENIYELNNSKNNLESNGYSFEIGN